MFCVGGLKQTLSILLPSKSLKKYLVTYLFCFVFDSNHPSINLTVLSKISGCMPRVGLACDIRFLNVRFHSNSYMFLASKWHIANGKWQKVYHKILHKTSLTSLRGRKFCTNPFMQEKFFSSQELVKSTEKDPDIS